MKRMVVVLLVYIIPAGMSSQLLKAPGLEARIRLLHQVYRINGEIPVYFTVINSGPRPLTIHPSLFLYRNFQFRVRTFKNVHVRHRESYYLKIRDMRRDEALDRPIKLMPGERYGRVLNLAERFNLVRPGHYEVTGYFLVHPMRTGSDFRIDSNRSRFILKPPLPVVRAVARYNRARKKYLDRQLSPSDTVEFMLRSRKVQDWEGFYMYMDLLELLKIYPDFEKRYTRAPFAEKQAVLRDFRLHLRKFPAGRLESFFAGKSVVTKDEMTGISTAEVTCRIVYRERKRLLVRRMYYFSLHRKFDRWFIYKFYVVRR